VPPGSTASLIVDYPPEECRSFADEMKRAGLDPIFLLAPTSSEQRFDDVAEAGSGYIYYVSLKGVTGAATLDFDEIAARIPRIRERVGMPVGVGFGIRDAESARRIGEVADAVVIGSRIIEEIENSPAEQVTANVRSFVAGIRTALDSLEGGPK
jgi:tryptophan synthase alpha chain